MAHFLLSIMPQPLIHPKLAHLSPQELEEMLRCYYAEEKIQSILTRYGINCAANVFHKILPPLVLHLAECPACGAPMAQPRVPRGQERWGKPSIRCYECSHVDTATCDCSFCQAARLAEQEAKIAGQRAELADYIGRHYRSSPQEIAASQLSLREAVSLLALYRSCGFSNEQNASLDRTVEPLAEAVSPFAPDPWFQFELLEALMDRNLIAPSKFSAHDAFWFEGDQPGAFDYTCVRWTVLGDKEGELLREIEDIALSGRWPEHWYEEVKDLWADLAFSECKEFYVHASEERGLPITHGKSLEAMLKNLLRDFSVAQSYRIIAAGGKGAVDFRARKQCTLGHAANYMIGACQRWADRARAEGWEVFAYRRNFDLPRSMMSYVLHDVFLKIGERGFTETPASIWPNSAGPATANEQAQSTANAGKAS